MMRVESFWDGSIEMEILMGRFLGGCWGLFGGGLGGFFWGGR